MAMGVLPDPDGYPLELVEVAYYNADERTEGNRDLPRVEEVVARARAARVVGVRPPDAHDPSVFRKL